MKYDSFVKLLESGEQMGKQDTYVAATPKSDFYRLYRDYGSVKDNYTKNMLDSILTSSLTLLPKYGMVDEGSSEFQHYKEYVNKRS